MVKETDAVFKEGKVNYYFSYYKIQSIKKYSEFYER